MASEESQPLVFICQRCHKTLEFLNDVPVQESQVAGFTKYPLAPHLDNEYKAAEKQALDQLLDSFVVIPPRPLRPPSVPKEGTNWDRRVLALTKIFEVASDKCQLDHPLCKDCSDLLLKELEQRIKELELDRQSFTNKLDELANSPLPTIDHRAQELARHDDERERQLTAELAQIQKERAALRQEQMALDAETKHVADFEKRFWEQVQDFQRDLDVVNEEQLSLAQKLEVAKDQLERMKRTNVFDDAFHIYYDGHFGTINGFRLGRLPSQPVDWVETNAALGQVVLLLHTIARHCNFKFSKYKLIPMGSFSKMSPLNDLTTVYELYGSSDLNFSRLFWYRRFDSALTWLLECIDEFGQYAHKLDPSFKPKYTIKGDTIEGLSVKLQFNQDPKWTKALKYMLSNLKFLLAWASKHQDH